MNKALEHLATAIATAIVALVAQNFLAVQPARTEVSAASVFSAEVYDTLTACIKGRKACEAELRECRAR